MAREFNIEKFCELLLHIADHSLDDDGFGAVKLNKLLYYMDTEAYLTLGEPITGATYIHLDFGPGPRELLRARQSVLNSGDVVLEPRPYHNLEQQRLVPSRKPDLSVFSKEELAIAERVLAEFKDHNGADLTKLSHSELGWLVTLDREEIPYETAWISSDPLSAEQIEKGREIAARAELTIS